MTFGALFHHLNLRSTRLFPQTKVSAFLVSFFLFTLFSFFSVSIYAQNIPRQNSANTNNSSSQSTDSSGNNGLREFQQVTNSETPAQETWLLRGMENNIFSSVVILNGTIPEDVLSGQAKSYVPGGAIGSTNNLVASLYNRPVSGIEYLASLKDNLLGKPAYAQGFGASGLQPILPIWRGFRNIVYLLSSIVFILIGVMIMLRVKISPQAVVTIQNAIPNLITTLILVTFSYAISGLLVEAVYFVQALGLSVLFTSMGKSFSDNIVKEDFFNAAAFWYNRYDFNHLVTPNFGDITSLAFLALPKMSLLLLSSIIGGIVAAIVAAIPIPGAQALVPFAFGGITGLILLIISGLILFWLIKLFFGMVKNYVTIILKIILAPLEIGMGAFPQSKMGFNTWIWDLLANLAVFPIVLLFLVIANIIIQAAAWSPLGGGDLWAPEVINGGGQVLNYVPRALASASGGILSVAFGLGTLMILSKLPDMIPQFIFSIKPTPWGQAIGQSYQDVTNFPAKTADTLHRFTGFMDDVRRIVPRPQPTPTPPAPNVRTLHPPARRPPTGGFNPTGGGTGAPTGSTPNIT
jgi:hypothetical protein